MAKRGTKPSKERSSRHGFRRAERRDRKVEEIESVEIPIKGECARIGAIRYIAVLAYPKREEWPQRDKFCRAAALLLDSPLEKVYARDEEEMSGRLRSCFKRINHRAMAAHSAWSIIFAATWTAEPLRPYWKGDIPKVPSVRDLAKKWIGKSPEGIDPRDWYAKAGGGNFMHRTWKGSQPVFHLMISLLRNMPEKGRHGGSPSILDLMFSTSWLPGALKEAEYWRIALPRYIPSFEPSKAIRLIPTKRGSPATT